MTKLELFNVLCYAATAQQVEATEATLAVYYDQLGAFELEHIDRAVRLWVKEYEEPYRRLPTVGEIRQIMRRERMVRDPVQQHRLWVAGKIRHARKIGKSPEYVDRLIAYFDRQETVSTRLN